jgi:hypothetical protein
VVSRARESACRRARSSMEKAAAGRCECPCSCRKRMPVPLRSRRKPVLSGSSCRWFQAEWIMVRSASKPNVKVASGAAAAELVIGSHAQIQFTGADDPTRCDALEGPVRIRHSAVRMVSPQEFSALREVSTFPEVGGQKPGLWRGISGTSYGRPRFSGVSLCSMNFQ